MRVKRKRVDVNLKELDQIIDHAREAPLSESESEKLKDCIRSAHDFGFCQNLHRSDLNAAAQKAGISSDIAQGDSAVQTVWQIAEQKIDAAEKNRRAVK